MAQRLYHGLTFDNVSRVRSDDGKSWTICRASSLHIESGVDTVSISIVHISTKLYRDIGKSTHRASLTPNL